MSQNKYKLSCDEKEICNETGPKKDLELCLEVEMDDEVREIITSPDKCTSTLLDVTVIKPKDIDQLYTTHRQTLNTEEVRKLIASMELEKQDRQKLIDHILTRDKPHLSVNNHNDPKSAGDCSKTKYFTSKVSNAKSKRVHYLNEQESTLFFEQIHTMCTTDDTNSDRLSSDRTHQIYTSPKTYKDIKSIFTCKNRGRYDECEKLRPCPCQNCAVVGVLTDSQKRPFITENLLDPRELFSKKETREHRKRRYVNFKEENHAECQHYFKHLSEKIRDLEHRLAVQEEKSVPKDYFKRIITKLVSHISKLANYASQEKLVSRPSKYKECKEYKDVHKYKDKLSEKYCVHPVVIDQHCKIPAEREFINMQFEENLPTTSYSSSKHRPDDIPEGFWKWGGEILKPGIDLKNKIVLLLEDTLQNIKKSKENYAKPPENSKHYSIGFFNGPNKTINEVPVRDTPVKKRGQHDNAANKCTRYTNYTNSGSTVSKQKHLNDLKTSEKKIKGYLPRIYSKQEIDLEPVSVSYMNPKLSKWQEESQISFKLDTCDVESLKNSEDKRINECYKMEFKNTISNTKESDKLRLWESIWNQAKINGQTKADKVTIQIPERKNMKNQKIVEIEYTIAELEKLLTSEASCHKQDRGSVRHDKK